MSHKKSCCKCKEDGANLNLIIVTYAADNEERAITNVMTIDDLRGLFPEVPLGEDGYVEGYENDTSSYAINNETRQIAESYIKEYQEGACTLNVYNDGMYDAIGYEKVEDVAATRNPGAETYGAKYRSYYIFSGTGFFYTYNLGSSGSYSRITNLSYPTQPLWDTDPYWNFKCIIANIIVIMEYSVTQNKI